MLVFPPSASNIDLHFMCKKRTTLKTKHFFNNANIFIINHFLKWKKYFYIKNTSMSIYNLIESGWRRQGYGFLCSVVFLYVCQFVDLSMTPQRPKWNMHTWNLVHTLPLRYLIFFSKKWPGRPLPTKNCHVTWIPTYFLDSLFFSVNLVLNLIIVWIFCNSGFLFFLAGFCGFHWIQ